MRPQKDEPCVNCKFWSNKTGCKEGEYDSTAMLLFGYCYIYQRNTKKKHLKEQTL